MRKTEEKLYYLDLDDMKTYENRVKLLYAFLVSPEFYHQDFAVYNPCPKEYDQEHIFPRDIYSFAYSRDKGKAVPELKEILNAVSGTQVPVVSIGSHKKRIDRTIVLGVLPDIMSDDAGQRPEQALTIKFIGEVSAKERKEVINKLVNTYYTLTPEET